MTQAYGKFALSAHAFEQTAVGSLTLAPEREGKLRRDQDDDERIPVAVRRSLLSQRWLFGAVKILGFGAGFMQKNPRARFS